MASAQCFLAGGGAVVGVATVAGRERVVVTLAGEGVSCYSIGSQVLL